LEDRILDRPEAVGGYPCLENKQRDCCKHISRIKENCVLDKGYQLKDGNDSHDLPEIEIIHENGLKQLSGACFYSLDPVELDHNSPKSYMKYFYDDWQNGMSACGYDRHIS
jgi:hypothetical protein